MKPNTNYPRAAASLLAGALCCLAAAPVFASGEWTSTLGVQGVYGGYSGALQRDSMSGYGLFLSSDYLEQSGYTLGLNHTDVKAKGGVADTSQNALFVSGRTHFTLDKLPGRLTARLDLHAIDNDDATRNTDGVKAIAPQVSYLSFDKRHYFDLGYAHSSYKNDLSVNQWTPTAGFGLNDGADWLQLRAWFIDPSNPARAQGKSSTTALEMKWTHWLAANAARIDNVKLGLVAGERVYAVDGDAGSVANLADINRGGVSLGAEWKLGKTSTVLAMIGQDRFRNASLAPANDYTLNYAYLWLSGQW